MEEWVIPAAWSHFWVLLDLTGCDALFFTTLVSHLQFVQEHQSIIFAAVVTWPQLPLTHLGFLPLYSAACGPATERHTKEMVSYCLLCTIPPWEAELWKGRRWVTVPCSPILWSDHCRTGLSICACVFNSPRFLVASDVLQFFFGYKLTSLFSGILVLNGLIQTN